MPRPRPAIVPDAYVLLSNWRYVEYSLLRIIAGWGRCAGDWEDKLAVCEHVWLQAQIVERMRSRLRMFPGGRADGPVNAAFERAMNRALLAPTFEDAMAAVHAIINPALVAAYEAYARSSHAVHDRPTHLLLREVIALKQAQAEWYERFRRRQWRSLSPQFAERVRAGMADVGRFRQAVEPGDQYASTCGINSDFRMVRTPGRVKDWDKAPNIMPFLNVDFARSAEVRRLFFMIGYAWEMGVAEQQLTWIYHADFMPFEYVHAEAHHMWDESRHGDSGYHRLRDFGFDFEHFGYSSYGAVGEGTLDPMSPGDVYDAFYRVTQIAETGYFQTKRNVFEDMLIGNDDSSAEMMQFDIIDETSHVEYGRQWLPELARRAGVEEDYRQRGQRDRQAAQQRSDGRVAAYRAFLDTGDRRKAEQVAQQQGVELNDGFHGHLATLADARARDHYQWMLQEIREQCPLRHRDREKQRANLPM